MLRHLNAVPSLPTRVVILGATGFVGGALAKRLRGTSMLALARGDVDLLAPGAADILAGLVRPDDAVVVAAADAPCKSANSLARNMTMAAAVIEALANAPVAHVVVISSDAVYADVPGPISEKTATAPGTLHGAMHLARDLAFTKGIIAPLAILRPSMLYGSADPHNSYGPNRFRRLANAGQDIVLFGEGEERRDHVLIDDVAELITRVLRRRSVGTLNLATGEVHTFELIARLVAVAAPSKVVVKTSPRVGPMPHNGYRPFDISNCRDAFPDFTYAPIAEGIAKAQRDAGGER